MQIENEEEDMATIVENQVTWVEELTSSVEKARQDLAALEAEREWALSQLCASIRASGTTGDPLRDLVICERGTLDPERERLYRPYAEALRGKRGEFALIEYSAQYPNKFGWSRNEYRCVPRVRIAVLGDDTLTHAEKVGITLPTDRFLAIDGATIFNFSENGLFIQPTILVGNILDQIPAREEMAPRALQDFKLGASLHIGDDAVCARLASWSAASFFEYAARRLSRQILPRAA